MYSGPGKTTLAQDSNTTKLRVCCVPTLLSLLSARTVDARKFFVPVLVHVGGQRPPGLPKDKPFIQHDCVPCQRVPDRVAEGERPTHSL